MNCLADEGFKKRLIEIVDAVGGQNALARKSGLSQSGIARLVAGGEPTLSTLKLIANASGKSLMWLAEGTEAGEGVTDSDGAQSAIFIPILAVTAGAGSAVENSHEEVISRLPFPIGYLRRLGIRPEKVRAVRAKGDSMEPTVPDGVLVLVNTTAHDLVDGCIYALRASDGLRIKRVQRQMDGSVLLISDNKDRYPPERISADEASQIEVVGRVFWTEHPL